MQKNFLITLMLGFMAMIPVNSQNVLKDVSSPDGKLVVKFDIEGVENPSYSVLYNGKVMLEDSPIGIMLDMGSKPTLEGLPQGREAANGDFTKNLTISSVKTITAKTEYELATIKQAKVSHDYVQCVFTLANQARQEIEFEFRISNNDIAIRYNIPKPRQRASTRVLFENTGFRFPDGTTTFLTPQSDAMIGWQRSKPSYEEGYSNDGPMNVRSQYGHGYTFPGLFHVGSNGWVLLSETGVSSSYCGSRLGDCKDNTYKIEFPLPDENTGIGTVCPALRLPGSTPWRTITVGADLKPIVETTVMWDYVEPLFEAH
ncbi:MAG: glycoside hydrolase family 97 N-terminal domain-containing protein, partial [Bacteroidaceae bacterium]|nr:glycoside hydrolase family 97 N-terminal domain-containing protein [Bacteroidaceae bacterium]